MTIGIFNAKWEVPGDARGLGLMSFQVGLDLLFFAVMGYGVSLIVNRPGAAQLFALGPIAIAGSALWLFRGVPQRVKPKPTEQQAADEP